MSARACTTAGASASATARASSPAGDSTAGPAAGTAAPGTKTASPTAAAGAAAGASDDPAAAACAGAAALPGRLVAGAGADVPVSADCCAAVVEFPRMSGVPMTGLRVVGPGELVWCVAGAYCTTCRVDVAGAVVAAGCLTGRYSVPLTVCTA
jgi:hypothetical protein